MRIVFLLASANLTGGVRTVATYARQLGRRGHQVTVVSTPSWAPSLRNRLGSLLRGNGWPPVSRPGRSHVDDPEIVHRRIEKFRPLTDDDVPDADVAVATWWLTAEWLGALSPRKGAKAHFIQGDDIETPGQPRDRVLATWRLPLHRIVCSRWLQRLARDRYGDPATTCVPNGVDLSLFSAPARAKRLVPTVGLVYSSLEMKGCDVALAAYAAAAQRVPDLRLVVFGSEPVDGRLPLPPGAEFVLRPDQARIAELYASCDAWLWPSRREGFGLPILEAMACRTPVIAAPAGAAAELLEGGGGILLPGPDPGAMANAIEQVSALPDPAWRALSERARTTAEAHGWEESVRLFEAALEQAVARAAER